MSDPVQDHAVALGVGIGVLIGLTLAYAIWLVIG